MFQLEHPLKCINLCPQPELNPFRPVLIARARGENESPELTVLKVFPGGRIYLAALADRTDRVVEWLELWVQCPHDLESSPLTRGAVINNASHDRQWRGLVEALRNQNGSDFIETGWESAPPTAPLVVDGRRMLVVPLVHSDLKSRFELCRDDATLKAAGLGGYSSTLERWFFVKSPAGEIVWLSTRDLSHESGDRIAVPENGNDSPVQELNVGAGIMMLRKHQPIGVDAFINWLAPSPNGTPAPVEVSPVEQELLRAKDGGFARGRLPIADQTLENAYLRTQLWCLMVREVHSLSSRLGIPFLNLTPDSFRIGLAAPTLAPLAGAFRAVLAHPGDAMPITVDGAAAGFVALGGALSSPYALPRFGGCLEGSGTLRIRQIADAGEGRMRLDGVLDGAELKNVSAGNFVWLQTLVDGRSVSFYAKIEADKGATRSGAAFSAPAVELPPAAVNRLKITARHACEFVVLRPVHPAFDIYSLGVIGVRLFLAENAQEVSELVDDLVELAAILPPEPSLDDLRRLAGTSELTDRLRRLLGVPAWAQSAPEGHGLAESVWLAILRELIEFVGVEVPEDSGGNSNGPGDWMGILAGRLQSLEEVVAQIGRLVVAPRHDHDEIARVVHSFV